MIFSSDIFPFFPTNPLKRIPLTITNMNTYKAKLEDTTPNVMSVIWTVSVQKQVYSLMHHGLISVRERYSKSHSSPAKSPFSLQCLAGCGGGENLLVWLIKLLI